MCNVRLVATGLGRLGPKSSHKVVKSQKVSGSDQPAVFWGGASLCLCWFPCLATMKTMKDRDAGTRSVSTCCPPRWAPLIYVILGQKLVMFESHVKSGWTSLEHVFISFHVQCHHRRTHIFQRWKSTGKVPAGYPLTYPHRIDGSNSVLPAWAGRTGVPAGDVYIICTYYRRTDHIS